MSSIVLGCLFGDEGKGLVTSWLCEQNKANNNKFVIRFSGGQQAGHTVVFEGKRHIFSNFGSGTLQGVPTYWSKYCTFYPSTFMNEYDVLQKICSPSEFYIDPTCPVTTPYDVYVNRSNKHQEGATVGLGIGQTWQRHEEHYRLIVQDLFHEKVWREKLRLIKSYYWSYPIDYAIDESELEHFEESIKRCIEIIKPSFFDPKESIIDYHYIYEGSQGILLDQDHGFFPDVTRSYTTSRNALKLNNGYKGNPDIYYVTRSYQTRHGKGFMTNNPIVVAPDQTNFNNPFQGPFKTTELDIDLLIYAIHSDALYSYGCQRNLVITHFDQVQVDVEAIIKAAEEKRTHFAKVLISKGPSLNDIYVY